MIPFIIKTKTVLSCNFYINSSNSWERICNDGVWKFWFSLSHCLVLMSSYLPDKSKLYRIPIRKLQLNNLIDQRTINAMLLFYKLNLYLSLVSHMVVLYAIDHRNKSTKLHKGSIVPRSPFTFKYESSSWLSLMVAFYYEFHWKYINFYPRSRALQVNEV